jgi:phosphohistidine phosphatase
MRARYQGPAPRSAELTVRPASGNLGFVIVFLVRHAHSVNEVPGLPDLARHISLEGRHAARQLGERLSWYDCTPTVVWTSPATRAVQTTELVLAGLGWTGPVEAVLGLGPDGDVRTVRERLRTLAPDAAVLIVGHEPGISGLGALLTGRADFPALKKAQVARLDDVALQRAEAPSPLVLRWLFGYGDDAPVAP